MKIMSIKLKVAGEIVSSLSTLFRRSDKLEREPILAENVHQSAD